MYPTFREPLVLFVVFYSTVYRNYPMGSFIVPNAYYSLAAVICAVYVPLHILFVPIKR